MSNFAPVALLPVTVWGDSHPGKVRAVNEDSYYFPSKQTQSGKQLDLATKGYLLIVADGIGGSDLGQRASREVMQAVRDVYYEGTTPGTPDQRLMAAIQYANDSLHQMRSRNPALGQAGSTLVAAVIAGNYLYTANAGDSRAYLIRGGQASQRTLDHTLVRDKQQRGLPVTESDAGIITRSMGEQPGNPADSYTAVEVLDGDTVVLCSDGLSDMVSDADLARIVTEYPPERAVKKLIDRANRAGGPDNITAIVARIGRAKVLASAPRAPRTIHLSRRQRNRLAVVAALVLLLWAIGLLIVSASHGNGATSPTSPAATQILLPVNAVSSPTLSSSATATRTDKATATLRSTFAPTDTPTKRPNATNTLVPPTVAPTITPLPFISPTPTCPNGKFWDPVMGRCQGSGGNGNPTPLPPR